MRKRPSGGLALRGCVMMTHSNAVEKDRPLLNVYSVLEVDPATGPRVNAAGGKAFADFMVSPAAQAVIKTFGVDKYGQPLFVPIAGMRDEDLS